MRNANDNPSEKEIEMDRSATRTASALYAWVIIKAFLDGEEDVVGTTGPYGHDFNPVSVAEHGMEFRMYDDDGELYFEGRIMGDYDGFEPLDDFGRGHSGCTEIRYKDYWHQWKTL